MEIIERDIMVLVIIKNAEDKPLKVLPLGMSEEQFFTSVKKMEGKYIEITMEGDEDSLIYAQLTTEGKSLLNDYFQSLTSELPRLLKKEGFYDDEIKVFLFFADCIEHFDSPKDVDDYDEIITDLAERGYICLYKKIDDGLKLSYKGKKYIYKIMSEYVRKKNFEEECKEKDKESNRLRNLYESTFRKNNPLRTIDVESPDFTELQSNILDLFMVTENCVKNIHAIQCTKPFTFETRHNIAKACLELFDNKMINGFIEWYNDECPELLAGSITEKGRIAMRNHVEHKTIQQEVTSRQFDISIPYVKLNSAKGNKINLIRLVWSMWQLGYFHDEKGKNANIKNVFKVIGTALNINLDNYSVSLSQSGKNDTQDPIKSLIEQLKSQKKEDFQIFLDSIANELSNHNAKKLK